MAEEGIQVQQTQEIVEDLDQNQALARVLRQCLYRDSVVKGLHESCKNIEAKRAQLVILAQDCDQAPFKKLIQALCKENDVPLLLIEKGNELGEYLGLCKYDTEGKPRKVRKCASAAILEYPPEDAAVLALKKHIATGAK